MFWTVGPDRIYHCCYVSFCSTRPHIPISLHIGDMETNSVLFYPSISNTVFPFPFSHSAAHSLSLQKASGLSSLPSVYPICDAVWATGLIIIGGRSAELQTRQKEVANRPAH